MKTGIRRIVDYMKIKVNAFGSTDAYNKILKTISIDLYKHIHVKLCLIKNSYII